MKFDFTITFTNLIGFIMLLIGVAVLLFKGIELSTPLFTVGVTLVTGGKIVNAFEKSSERKLEAFKIERGLK
jgi:uncharacterized membrane protein HdeD (DUF308 family)